MGDESHVEGIGKTVKSSFRGFQGRLRRVKKKWAGDGARQEKGLFWVKNVTRFGGEVNLVSSGIFFFFFAVKGGGGRMGVLQLLHCLTYSASLVSLLIC